MDPIEIAPGVYDVGVTDWNIRDFHGYSTDLGTTYNAFLVVDEKIALIDSVKKEFADQLIENISRIVDPRKIDVVVSNHTEPDHSGGLARVMHRVGEDKPLYCSKMGRKPGAPFLKSGTTRPSVRGRAEAGQAHAGIPGNPHDPLADSMFSYLGGGIPFERRLRPALAGPEVRR
jgi:flavorubredoxin